MVPAKVRENTLLREEQARVAHFALVPDLDMAGARGAAVAALESVQGPLTQSVEDRISGATPLQLEETVDAQGEKNAVPQPPRDLASWDG